MKKSIFTIIIMFLSMISLNLVAIEPVAATDDFNAAEVNPAALGFGNARGFAFQHFYDEDFSTEEDRYNLFFNFDNLSYVFKHGEDDDHRLAIGLDLVHNLYYGINYDWTNKHFSKGDFAHSLLYRPINQLSFGAIGSDIFSDKAQAQVGVAVRPIFFNDYLSNRISFTTDLKYELEEWSDPIVGIQTELADGIRLGGTYDLDLETVGINFGLSFGKLLTGTMVDFDDDNEVSHGSYYINLSNNTYRSLVGKPKQNKFYNLPLKGEIKEKNKSFKIGPISFNLDKGMTVSQIVNKLEMLKDDDRVGGIIIKQGNFQTSIAIINELVDAFKDFKSTGKKVVYYSESIGNANYFFAAAVADEIYLNPAGGIDLKGLSMNLPFFGELLDTLGVEVVNFRSHPYKTAGNTFSESEITPEERESYEYLLNGLYQNLLVMMEEGRKNKLMKSAEEIVNNGPYYIAETALNNGLVDDLIYEDQLDEKLENLINNSKEVKHLDNRFVEYNWSKENEDKIAVIYCIGNIHSGKGVEGGSIGSITTAKAIRKARYDKSIKGIILRIDSGGGSALASDVISREVDLCKTGKNAKPIIASMSGVAASGGYYIAANADEIIAQPNTITGSIGVVGMSVNFEKLYHKIHVNWSTVKMGENSDLGNTSREMRDDEKAIFYDAIEDTYNTFVNRVADGRGMTFDQVNEIAMGRVWTGQQALDRGLVDKLGGMNLAVEEMKRLANLNDEVKLIDYSKVGDSGLEINLNRNITSQLELPEGFKKIAEQTSIFRKLGNEKILMIVPYNPEIK